MYPVYWDRVNVNGSAIAVEHPWAATGRIVTTLTNEMGPAAHDTDSSAFAPPEG
jgi:acetyl-CoA acetyltransferase